MSGLKEKQTNLFSFFQSFCSKYDGFEELKDKLELHMRRNKFKVIEFDSETGNFTMK